MILLELIVKILPTIMIIFLLESLIKLDRFQKIYISMLNILISNVFLYFILSNTGYNIYFSPIFAVKYAFVLIFVNIVLMYLFISYRLRNKKK